MGRSSHRRQSRVVAWLPVRTRGPGRAAGSPRPGPGGRASSASTHSRRDTRSGPNALSISDQSSSGTRGARAAASPPRRFAREPQDPRGLASGAAQRGETHSRHVAGASGSARLGAEPGARSSRTTPTGRPGRARRRKGRRPPRQTVDDERGERHRPFLLSRRVPLLMQGKLLLE